MKKQSESRRKFSLVSWRRMAALFCLLLLTAGCIGCRKELPIDDLANPLETALDDGISGETGADGGMNDEDVDVYDGERLNGMRHGHGICTYENGDVYVGKLEGGVFHGQGTCTYTDGSVYTGEWRNDAWHGKGTYTLPDGRSPVHGSTASMWILPSPKAHKKAELR